MDTTSIPSILNVAVRHHRARRLDQAEQDYLHVLQLDPRNFDATHLLGLVLLERGRAREAIELIRRALAINPANAEAHYNLGSALRMQLQLEEAIAAFREAIKLRPDFVHAYSNLGLAFWQHGQFDEAIAACRQVLAREPNDPDAYTNLGNSLRALGRFDEAIDAHRSAIRVRPGHAAAHSNLGNALQANGELEAAVQAHRAAIAINPNQAQFWCNLAVALTQLRRADEALAACDRAIELDPRLAEAHLSRGNEFGQRGLPEQAAADYRRAIEINPNYAHAHNNLGNALKDQGMIEQAMNCYRRALDLLPNHVGARSNMLYAMYFLPEVTPRAIYDAHFAWGRSVSALASGARHGNDRSPGRKLRVGYVSGDLKDHPVGRFMLPLLLKRDREHFDVACYSDVPTEDDVTRQLRACTDTWRRIYGLPDARVAELVRKDGIDILVDLSLHAALNRMLVFARKPAPLQVTYLGYPGTTGLEAIDYRLTDRYLDPPDSAGRYVEQSFSLAGSYWCYTIAERAPDVSPLPAAQAGHVTFGCLNNFCKVSGASLAAWGEILRAAPGARLLLHARPGPSRQRVILDFSQRGIEPGRIEFVGYQSTDDYFKTYGRIDIALDPFPYNGGTTSCDALAMGVPVITLAGDIATARAGASILSNANLPELVARSTDEYVRLASGFAQDLPRLGELRESLRARLASSPLTDAAASARGLEDAYREMWRLWCAKISSISQS